MDSLSCPALSPRPDLVSDRSPLKAERCLLFLLSSRQCLVNKILSVIKLSFIECLLSSGCLALFHLTLLTPQPSRMAGTYYRHRTKEAWFGKTKELAQGHTASEWQNGNSTPAWDGSKAGLFPAFRAPVCTWIPPG